MKKHFILIAFFLLLFLSVDAKTKFLDGNKKAQVCLTLQAENGTIKQSLNEDGTISCIIKSVDVVRISSILLNGEDVMYMLEKNKLNLPYITQNSTLEVNFDKVPTTNYYKYCTIARF